MEPRRVVWSPRKRRAAATATDTPNASGSRSNEGKRSRMGHETPQREKTVQIASRSTKTTQWGPFRACARRQQKWISNERSSTSIAYATARRNSFARRKTFASRWNRRRVFSRRTRAFSRSWPSFSERAPTR